MRVFGNKLETFTHWFGWTLALVASIFFFIFDFLDWLSKFAGNPLQNENWFYVSMLIAIAGVLVSFFRRMPGAMLMMAGGLGMVVFYYITSGWSDAALMIVYGLPYILPAFLLLIVKK